MGGTGTPRNRTGASSLTITERVAGCLRVSGAPMTVDQIARTLRVRTAQVREAIRTDEMAFRRVEMSANRVGWTIAATAAVASRPVPGPPTVPAEGTDKRKVYDLLADGRPHSHLELNGPLGVIGHSRISDLRKQHGWTIQQWREGSTADGRKPLYWYQLDVDGSLNAEAESPHDSPSASALSVPSRPSPLSCDSAPSGAQAGAPVGSSFLSPLGDAGHAQQLSMEVQA